MGEQLSNKSRNHADDVALTLRGGGYDYHIYREFIDTPTKVLHWLRHIGAKTWVNKQDLLDVMDYAHRYNGVNLLTTGE